MNLELCCQASKDCKAELLKEGIFFFIYLFARFPINDYTYRHFSNEKVGNRKN